MRIKLVSSGYAPTIGGLQKTTQELARAWKQAGHEVRVITSRSSRKLSAHDEIDGIPVSRYYFVWELPRIKFIPFLKFLVQCVLLPLSIFSLWKELDPRRTDVVSVHYVGSLAWWAVPIAKRRSLPVVVTLHGSDLRVEPFRSRLKRAMLRKVLYLADEVSTVSHFMLREMKNFFPEIRGKGTVISNGYNPSELEGIEATRVERPYGLCVARLSLQKGHPLLIDAFETLGPSDPGFDLVFLGDGPSRKVIMEKARTSRLREHILFRGSVPHCEVLSLMKTASFVVIPSEAEPFGLVAVEARLLCRPIVALEQGALPEVLEGYSGVTWVEQDTPEALAKGMVRAMCYGKVAPEATVPFDRWEAVAEKYIDLFGKHMRDDQNE